MKRHSDIQELLLEVSGNIERLKSSYASATKDEDMKAVSRPLIKSSLEHLRSCLEYCAQDIYETKIGGSKKFYFPYGENLKKFEKSVSDNLPRIDKLAPDIYKFILNVQSFSCGDDWLLALCKHANFNKHDSLSKHDRVNSLVSSTSVGQLAKISGVGNSTIWNSNSNGVPIGHGKPFVLDSRRPVRKMQEELPGVVRVTRQFDWVEFRFPGTRVDALHLISKSHTNILNLVSLLNLALP